MINPTMNAAMNPILLLFLFPFFAASLILVLSKARSRFLWPFALFLSALPLIALIVWHSSWINAEVNIPWIPALNIQFHLKIDDLSWLFLTLSTFITFMSLLAIPSANFSSANAFYVLVFLLQGLLIGFFTSRDLALFTLFWEAMLLPLYFMMTLWGGMKRQQAALKFMIYMIAGSVFMVAAVLSLYFASATAQAQTFDLDALAKTAASSPYAPWILGAFLLSFAVKTPLFPFHGWLPDAYCESSTSSTILLSAILSKAGIYGILRIGYELFPDLLKAWSPLLLGFAIAGVFYGALLAWRQNDFKRLIAYSSLSHVNFILVGLFAINQISLAGGILQTINHAITITALFLVAHWLEERLQSTSLKKAQGLCKYLPQLCWLTLFFVLASVALPGTNNFVGEFMIFFGMFRERPFVAALLALSIILSVIYMLRWMQNEYFGQPSSSQPSWKDIGAQQILIALPLILLTLWLGIYPAQILDKIQPAVQKISAIASVGEAP